MNQVYNEVRAKLVREYFFLREKHCILSARARIRKIADLDYEEEGIDREKTKELFHYYNKDLK